MSEAIEKIEARLNLQDVRLDEKAIQKAQYIANNNPPKYVDIESAGIGTNYSTHSRAIHEYLLRGLFMADNAREKWSLDVSYQLLMHVKKNCEVLPDNVKPEFYEEIRSRLINLAEKGSEKADEWCVAWAKKALAEAKSLENICN